MLFGLTLAGSGLAHAARAEPGGFEERVAALKSLLEPNVTFAYASGEADGATGVVLHKVDVAGFHDTHHADRALIDCNADGCARVEFDGLDGTSLDAKSFRLRGLKFGPPPADRYAGWRAILATIDVLDITEPNAHLPTGDIHADHLRMTDYGAGRPLHVDVAHLRSELPGNTEVDTVAIERFEIDHLDIVGLLRAIQEGKRYTSVPAGSAALSNLRMTYRNWPIASIDNVSLGVVSTDPARRSVEFSIVRLALGEAPDLRSNLEQLKVSRIDVDLRLTVVDDRAHDTVAIDVAPLTAADLFTVSLHQELAQVPDMLTNPSGTQMEAIALGASRLRYTDQSFLPRAFAYRLESEGATQDQIRDEALAAVDVETIGDSEGARSIRTALDTFLRRFGTLVLTADPPSPVPLGELFSIPPREMVGRLGIGGAAE